MMKILFVGGGSIGHVAPSVAVWGELHRRDPNAEALFVISDRPEEAEFLRREGIPFRATALPRRSVLFPLTFLLSLCAAKRIIRTWEPDVVFSKGGAVSVPVCLAARRRSIPIVLHESDAVLGVANRFLLRLAACVCTGFPLTVAHRNVIRTGNPVRESIRAGSREQGLRITGFSGARPVFLICGGSQGAEALNRAVSACLPELLTCCDVLHLTGMGKESAAAQPGYFAHAFAHEELPHFYTIASFALSRAGAGGIAELAANGIPTILCPLRDVAHDHQQANAIAAARVADVLVLPQEHLTQDLPDVARRFALDVKIREDSSRAMRRLANPDAAQHLATILIESASRK